MKYELPIAIVLLAAGGLLWSNGLTGVGSETGENRLLAETVTDESGGVEQNGGRIEVASPRADASRKPAKFGANLRADNQKLDFSQIEASLESAQFLRSVGESLRNSPPFKTELSVQLHWSGKSFSIAGNYAQSGQGSGQSKFELQLSNGADPISIAKICDGRFLYTHLKRGKHKTLEFVDLRRVQEARLSTGMADPSNPTSWIATGGIASLFENLAAAFQFSQPTIIETGGVATCTIEGQWQSKYLTQLLHDTVAPHLLSPVIHWGNIPPQIPHHVKIELVELPGLGWMPRRMLFSRFRDNAGDENSNLTVRPLAWIEFSTPQSIAIDPNDFLNIQTDEVESIDTTDQYVDQVKDFGFARQAQFETEILIR